MQRGHRTFWSCVAAASFALSFGTRIAFAADLCTANDAFALTDDLSGFWSACDVGPGNAFIEAIYLQNASRDGGTALAAYPLLRLRTGLVPRLDVVIDAPSQIAESEPGGGGLYPVTRLGYGLQYALVQAPRVASALKVEAFPPTSAFAPSQTQPRYQVALTSEYALTPASTLGLSMSGTSSGSVAFARVLPAFAARAGLDLSEFTEVSLDLGTRLLARHDAAQSFGDLAIDQRLSPNFGFSAGVGTTFNAVSNTKAHYLASGLNLRI